MLRMLNLQNEIWELGDLKHIDFNDVDFKRYKVNDGEILFNRTNSKELVGKCAVFNEPGDFVYASYFVKLIIDHSQLNPYYVSFLINSDLGRLQIDAVSRQIAGMTNINAQEIKGLKLPFPPLSHQETIANAYRKAIEKRESTISEVNRLLASIDDYLLNELGINMPPEPENTIENRKFRTSYSKVFGDRLDPYYNQDYFYQIKEAVKDSGYPSVFIKDTMQGLMIKGYLPKQEEKKGDNKVVQINSINRDGTINLDDLLTAQDVFSSFHKLKQDDILVVITGATIGKIGYWSYEGDYFLGGDIVKFQTEPNQFDPFYVYAYLRSKPSQVEIKRNITGATNGHLAPEDVKHILIPKPPIEKQREIAEIIRQKTHQAYDLQRQAISEFQQAKKEIEQLILEPTHNE